MLEAHVVFLLHYIYLIVTLKTICYIRDEAAISNNLFTHSIHTCKCVLCINLYFDTCINCLRITFDTYVTSISDTLRLFT